MRFPSDCVPGAINQDRARPLACTSEENLFSLSLGRQYPRATLTVQASALIIRRTQCVQIATPDARFLRRRAGQHAERLRVGEPLLEQDQARREPAPTVVVRSGGDVFLILVRGQVA